MRVIPPKRPCRFLLPHEMGISWLDTFRPEKPLSEQGISSVGVTTEMRLNEG